VTEIARSMVMRYGMVKALGHVAYADEPGLYLSNQGFQKQREFSEETAREIDIAVRQIVDGTYQKAVAILRRERATLENWALELLEKETLGESELEELRRAVAPAQPQQAQPQQA
jgi:cell division protease FtsH